MRQPANARQMLEGSEALIFQRTNERYKTVRAFGLYVLIAFCVWQGKGAIEALAGQNTWIFVRLVLEVFADIKFSLLVSLTGATTCWALVERYLRQRAIVRLHTRVKELELTMDPHRSTSGLTPKGQTHPRDRET